MTNLATIALYAGYKWPYKPAIGEVLALPNDQVANAGLRSAAGAYDIDIATFNALPIESDLFRQGIPTDRRVESLGQWIGRLDLDIVVSPVHLSREPEHRAVGAMVMQAALGTADERKRPLVVLEARNKRSGYGYGNWIASAEGHSDVIMPIHSAKSYRDITTTYTRFFIRPGKLLLADSIEAFFATSNT